MQVQPYLFFDGRCEEAVEFYRSQLGAKVELPGLFAVAHGAERCRSRAAVRCSEQRWAGADAVDQDLLLLALRHGR